MKLLFDQNISFRILKLLPSEFKTSGQVRDLDLVDSSDFEIWNYSKKNAFCIVTFDSDFVDIANIKGHPPKIIWLRTGNMSTKDIAKLLSKKKEAITSFLEDPEYIDLAVLEID